jgi:transposase
VEGVSQLHQHAPQAAILFDKFHVMKHLGETLDKIRKAEYARLGGTQRRFIKGQNYTLLSHPQNLTGTARKNLKLLLAANKRLNTALPAQRILRSILGLQPRSLGTEVLR